MKHQMKASAYHLKPQEALSAQKKTILDKPLWPWSRMTGFRFVKSVMVEASIPDILHKCRWYTSRFFGVHAISKGDPLNMLSKWMGHACNRFWLAQLPCWTLRLSNHIYCHTSKTINNYWKRQRKEIISLKKSLPDRHQRETRYFTVSEFQSLAPKTKRNHRFLRYWKYPIPQIK